MKENNKDLIIKFRPGSLDEIIGQSHVVRSLQGLIDDKKIPHTILLTGNTGIGKTTIARIISKELNCSINGFIEVDGATHTGIDSMRELCQGLKYRSQGESGIKFVIIDECHRLSANSWDSLLKILEEPPSHLYFVLCSTNLTKIPKTIQTRCHHYNLKDVSFNDLFDLLDSVCEKESIDLEADSLELISRQALGSPRRALSYLSKCRVCETIAEVKEVLEQPLEDNQVIDLCRELTGRNSSWPKLVKIINGLKDSDLSGVQIQICHYLNSCILGAKTDQKAMYFLDMLDVFSKPFYQPTGVSDLLLSVGSIVLNRK